MSKLIAIVGLSGTGKSRATKIFVEHGYKSIHFGDITFDKLAELNLEINEENERVIRENLRKEFGMDIFAKLNIPKIKELIKESDVVIDGLCSWEEYKLLKNEFDNLILLGLVADKRIRYTRLKNRKVRPLTKDEAIKRDYSEIENLAKSGPIAYADYYVLTNTRKNEFKKDINKIIEMLGEI